MITSNLKKRIFTSFLLLFLVLIIFSIKLLFLYTVIIFSVVSILEFLDMTKKFIKNKINFYLLNFSFQIYIILFCSIIVIFYFHTNLKIILFSLLACCIASDIGGYIFGKIFKGPKLTKISPNKTYAGMVGGYLLSLIFLFIFNIYFEQQIIPSIDLFLITILLSTVSQIGDLIVSYFKRQSKIKNTGEIIPGHGGLLDRIDGMIFAFPTYYLIGFNLNFNV